MESTLIYFNKPFYTLKEFLCCPEDKMRRDVVGTVYHRLRGSASPVLTATHHSYGSLAWLSDFSPTALEVGPLNRFSRKMARSTCIHARMCLLQ